MRLPIFFLRDQIDDDLFPGPRGSREIACVGREAQGNDFWMNDEIEEFQNSIVATESGVKIVEILLAEDSLTAGDVVERKREIISETCEIFGIGRKFGLAAATNGRDIYDAGLFLAIDIPDFHEQ